ncbi:porin [Aggregatibacter actinomycetemcomitans]|uniref:porin n=1 Tax=Aggregatibacter actinomycetemcomitans TaxID=714 RepID=UPI00197C3678|nr:porin [Aggregatibacter actinomycetemcomitans]MBN6063505.1 porin [Aggregatibacter actinomycetemcomitans]MBN6083388.1 porin [Aggregatibacter actinomycetemcomitans]
MKKTVIALAIAALAATGTASAVKVYNQDGTKVELGGSMRIFLGKLGKNQRGDLVNDGSRIKIKASQELDNGLSAFVSYELRFEREARKNKQNASNNFGDPTTRKLFVGLGFKDVGELSFGRQSTNADDVLGDSLYYGSGDLSDLTTRSDKSVKFRSADFNGFSFGVDYLFGNAEKYKGTANTNRYKNGYGVAAFYNYDFAENHKIDFGATYAVDQYDTLTSSSTNRKEHKWLLATHYQLDALKLGAAYGQYHSKTKGVEAVKTRYIFLEGKYDLNELTGIPTTLGLQWERKSAKQTSAAPSHIENHYIVNVDYEFNKHVIPYVSYIRATDKNNKIRENENIYGAGLRVFF